MCDPRVWKFGKREGLAQKPPCGAFPGNKNLFRTKTDYLSPQLTSEAAEQHLRRVLVAAG